MADDSYYDPTSGTAKDDMRLLTGDVSDPFLMADAEITALYSATSGRLSSAALILDAMAARVSGQFDSSAEGVTLRESQKADGYRKQAAAYRQTAKLLGEAGAFPPGSENRASPAGGGTELVADPCGSDEFAWRRYASWLGADDPDNPGIARPGAMDWLYR